MDVEVLAVSTIAAQIGRCPHLRSSISINDKTPFTDGQIDMYSAEQQSNENWVGRATVQVKGRTRATKKPLSRFPIDKTVLAAYQRESGIIYFVVTVHPKTARCAAYYALLSPFAIESLLLDAADGRSSVSVKVKKFPDDCAEVERIVDLAIRSRNQNPSGGLDPAVMELVEGFTLHTASDIDFSVPVTLETGVNDFALELRTVGGMSIPVGGVLQIFPTDYITRTVDVAIRSGKSTYASAEVRRVSTTAVEVSLADELVLRLDRGPGDRVEANVSLRLADSLEGRLKATEFYAGLIDTQAIEVNGTVSRLLIGKHDEDQWLRTHIRALRELSDLLRHFDIDTALIDLTQISDSQLSQLRTIYRCCILGEEMEHANASASRAIQAIGPWHLLLFVAPGSEPDKWRLDDPFSLDFRRQFRWQSGNDDDPDAIPITAYDIVDDEHVGTVLNTRLSAIVGAYEVISEFPSTYGLANQRVLSLIDAADCIEIRRGELLDAAAELNDWLIREQGDDEPHHLINDWQIAARRGVLTAEQITEIKRFRREFARSGGEYADLVELSCVLLLGDDEEAQDLVGELTTERLARFQEWPIWRLPHHRA